MNTVDLAVFYSYYGTCQARARRDSSMLLRSSKNFKGLFFLYAPSRNKDGGNCWVLFQQLAGFAHCFQRNLGTLDLVNQRHQISAAGLSEKKRRHGYSDTAEFQDAAVSTLLFDRAHLHNTGINSAGASRSQRRGTSRGANAAWMSAKV